MSHAPDCPNFYTKFPWKCECNQHFECEDCPVAEPHMCEKVGRCEHREDPSADSEQGYRDAFYEIARMLDLPAMAMSPLQAWETIMRPQLEAAISKARGETL